MKASFKTIPLILLIFLSALLAWEVLIRFGVPQEIPPPALIEPAFGTIVNKPNHVKQSRIGKARFNEYRIRSSHETPYEKPPGVYRVMTLGDSVFLGYGVSNEDAWTSYLERFLNQLGSKIRFEVLNAGVIGAADPAHHYLYMKNEGWKFQPDLVIVGRSEWELGSTIGGQLSAANFRKEVSSDKKAEIFLEGVKIKPHRNYYIHKLMSLTKYLPGVVLKHSHLLAYLRVKGNAYMESTKNLPKDFQSDLYYYLKTLDWSSYKEIALVYGLKRFVVHRGNSRFVAGAPFPYRLSSNIGYRKDKYENAANVGLHYAVMYQFTKLLSGMNSKLLWVELPVFPDVIGFTEDTNLLPPYNLENQVYSYALHKEFIEFQSRNPIPLYFYNDNHWVPGGNYLTALLIYNYLVSNRLIPVPKEGGKTFDLGDPSVIQAVRKANEPFMDKIETINTMNYTDLLKGIVYWKAKKYDLAEKGMVRYIEANLKDGEAAFQVGLFFLGRDNYQKAARYMKLAIEGNSKTRSLKTYKNYYSDFLILKTLRDYIEKNNYKALLKYSSSMKVASPIFLDKMYYFIGFASLKLNLYTQAEKYLLKAQNLKPNNFGHNNNLGNLYFLLNKFKNAIQFYSNAIDIKPDQIAPYASSGMAYMNLGEKKEARILFQKVLQIDPSNKIAQKLLNQLKSVL